MTTYWKAVRPDGTDFFSGKVRWLPPAGEPLPEGGLIVRHPTATTPSFGDDAADYLSVSTEPATSPPRARASATTASKYGPSVSRPVTAVNEQ